MGEPGTGSARWAGLSIAPEYSWSAFHITCIHEIYVWSPPAKSPVTAKAQSHLALQPSTQTFCLVMMSIIRQSSLQESKTAPCHNNMQYGRG